MKEKRSNISNKNIVVDEQQTSIIRLVGLFMIVYGILCFTSKNMGCILSVPFTFLFGSFAPLVLLAVMLLGCYMLLLKKVFNYFSKIQLVLITLLVIFALILATSTPSNYDMTIKSCFTDYLSKDGASYTWKVTFIDSDNAPSVETLGGGMLGYIFYGLLNSICGINHTITSVISWIIFVGVAFIFLAPYVSKLISFIKKTYLKAKERKEIKKQEAIAKQEKQEQLRQARLDSKPISFNVNNSIIDSKNDDLLETTEINITGNDFSYSESTNRNAKKLNSLLNAFDEDIYPSSMKKGNDQYIEETTEIRLSSNLMDDISDDGDVTEVFSLNDISESVNSNAKVIIEDSASMPEVTSEVNISKNHQEEVIDATEEIKFDEITIDNVIENQVEEVKPVEETKHETIKDIASSNTYIYSYPNQEVKEDKVESTRVLIDEKVTIDDTDYEKEEVEKENEIDLFNIPYDLPPLYLLKDATDNGANAQNAEIARQKADILMEKMKELNVAATINAFVVGPSVTRFEIALAPGVRVGSFTNLQEDFKLALGVNSIRIESPIPGKSAIGIEVPNNYRAMVSMKEIITQMPNKKHKLYVPVGKDITGVPLSFPICDMPHCLISGATNSGKSVCANTIILSLLMNYKPSEVRLIMVDPKRVEMAFYNDIPHLLCPIITDAEKARVALDKLCVEMDKRFTIFSKESVKNIATYNEMMVAKNQNKMPFIILVVDEFAELMLCKNHNIVEEKIQKIAQLGRAAGIHLILSTQRPDVNVIPGTIKSNLPCRMTFRLSSLVDSRTVIDVGGAEKLLNNGDMLLLTPDFTGLRRVQGVYVSDKEIIDVVEFCKKQVGPQYDKEFLDLRTAEEKAEEEKLKFAFSSNNKDEDEGDALFEEIKAFVIKEQKASTSYLQRKFNIGYGRAARYIDMLEDQGIVGPENGSKPREVLIDNEGDYNE